MNVIVTDVAADFGLDALSDLFVASDRGDAAYGSVAAAVAAVLVDDDDEDKADESAAMELPTSGDGRRDIGCVVVEVLVISAFVVILRWSTYRANRFSSATKRRCSTLDFLSSAKTRLRSTRLDSGWPMGGSAASMLPWPNA